jgi:two-component system NtrC family sensor kinase
MRNKREPLPSPPRDPELDSTERVSSAHREAPSGTRDARALGSIDLPVAWLERLLGLASSLPMAEGEAAVARAVVDALHALLPSHAFGVCLVSASGSRSHAHAAQVIRAPSPDATEGRVAGVDPTRLFPARAFERAVTVGAASEASADGTTLHLAWDDPEADPGGAVAILVQRAAAILARGLASAELHARATRDASELRALNTHMVQAEKLASLGQIAAGVIHELNNPLTSIVAYTDFLIRRVNARGDAGDPDELDRLRRIAESAGRMLRFTRDLVSYARPSSETPVPVSVHVVIEQALAFCEHILNEAGAVVDRRFATSIPAVRGKPEQLAQVFVNLITNASHALPPGGGAIVFRTERDGGSVRITLEDNGDGILAEHLPHVFTPFFTTKGTGLGTGLGLTIVKSIVDAHDGTIVVESEPGRGTVFVLTLPAANR